jgi:ribosome-binding ATPase YchF (GTP1/OBG family)
MKDMVLYRFGSTGVVQCLSRAAELLGLVPVFPVRNVATFNSGTGTAVFRDCVLVNKSVLPIPSWHSLSNSSQKQHCRRCRPKGDG